MRRPSGALWSHRDFLTLWTGQTISEFGSQISQLAIPWVALVTLNATAFQVASLGTVEFLPFVLFTLPAGVWVDRLRRKSVLIVGDVGRAVLLSSIPIAYVTGHLTLAQLYVVGFLVGIHTVFFDVAYQSYLPEIVDRDSLIEGNSKLNVTSSGAQLAGPGAAGGLIALATAPYAILVDAASFLVSGAFTASIRARVVEPEEPVERRHLLVELWEGLRYVLRHRLLFPQAISTGVSNFFSNVLFSIILVYAHRKLGMSSGLIGLSFSLAAIGWMLGASQADRFRRRLGVGGATILGAALSGPGALLIAFTPQSFPVPFLVAGAAITGFGAVVYNIQQVSLRQAICPPRLQGRMNASMRFLVWGTIPLGSLTGGAIATVAGLRTALFVGAIGGFTSILPIVFSPIRSLREFPGAEEDPLLQHEAGVVTEMGGPAAADA
ncbi:MAG TPA: MFS transporter [Gaiellaceae bacterium]|jgi:MFS family permease|nr:MFS transporter [Gaiellaceae bacterium]